MAEPFYTVFFIISNKSALENSKKYSIIKSKSFTNFKNILKIKDYIKSEFTTYVYYFEINPKYLRDDNKFKNFNYYFATIKMKYFKNNFEKNIKLDENTDNFIYDFKFDPKQSKKDTINIPEYINYQKTEQLQIFYNALKQLNINKDYYQKLYKNFIDSSITNCLKFGDFEYYLAVFKLCYPDEEIKLLLMKFNVNSFLINPNKKELINYSSLLSNIEKNIDIITKHCKENEDKKIYIKAFYNILLFYRIYNEKEKVPGLINNKNLIEYFSEIIASNKFYGQYIEKLEISNDLIFSILKENNLPFETIKNMINKITKNYSTEEFLLFISNNCDAISNSCKKEKILAKLFPQKRKIGDINKILLYIKKILDYQTNKNNEFLEFNEEFLKENIIGKKINSGMIMKEELNEIYIKNYFLLLKTFSNYKCNNIYNC